MATYYAFPTSRDMHEAMELLWAADDKAGRTRTRFVMVGSGDVNECRIENEDLDYVFRRNSNFNHIIQAYDLPASIKSSRDRLWDDPLGKLIGVD